MNENIDQKIAKELASFKKNYQKIEGGFFGNKFISRARKEIYKGKLVLDYEVKE